MKTLKFRNGLCVALMSLVVVFVMGQISFAANAAKFKKNVKYQVIANESDEQGEFGAASVELKGKAGLALKKANRAGNKVPPTSNVDVYAAFTYHWYTDYSYQLLYWPWLCKNCEYVYVAFRVHAATKVKIDWKLTGPTSPTATWNFGGKTLSPDKWYFAWWHPDTGLASTGLYKADVKVTSTLDGTSDSDSCKFEMVTVP